MQKEVGCDGGLFRNLRGERYAVTDTGVCQKKGKRAQDPVLDLKLFK